MGVLLSTWRLRNKGFLAWPNIIAGRKIVPEKIFKGWADKTNILQYLGVHYIDLVYFVTKATPIRVLQSNALESNLKKGYVLLKKNKNIIKRSTNLTDSDNKLVLVNSVQRQYVELNECFLPQANKGDVIIFPADVLHYVLPNDKEDDRICISMNISIRDKYC